MQQRIDAIAGQLYEGVLAPQAWSEALAGMCAQLQAGVFHYFTLNAGEAAVPQSASNLESFGLHHGLMQEYETHHAHNDLRMATVQRLPVAQVMLDHEHISARQASQNSVYTDWLVPLGLRHTAAVAVRVEGNARDFISFMRPRDAGVYGAQDKAFLEHLMPHIERAGRLRARMGQLCGQAAWGLAALDALAQALLVVDARCRLQHSNPAAERLLATFGTLQCVHGGLRCTSGEAHARLQGLVSAACANPAKAAALVPQGSRSSQSLLRLTALPLAANHAFAAPWQQPLALIFLTLPGSMVLQNQGLVGEMLGLSPSETRLLLLLAGGKTVKDYALMEGCSWHTARTHMKNLMRKTGCHRQVELVQLLQGWGMV